MEIDEIARREYVVGEKSRLGIECLKVGLRRDEKQRSIKEENLETGLWKLKEGQVSEGERSQ